MTVETFAKRLRKLLLAQAQSTAEWEGKDSAVRAEVYRQVAELVVMAASEREII